MLKKINISRLSLVLAITVTSSLAIASNAADSCLRGQQMHNFTFDLRRDNQNAVALDYQYGNSKAAKMPDWAKEEGKTHSFNSMTVSNIMADYLYVKWKLNNQSVYEDKVKIDCLLPEDMTDYTVTFMVKESQLFIYLVYPKSHGKPQQQVGPSLYKDRIVEQIYPLP